MKPWHLFVAAAVLLVAGAALISVRHLGAEPTYTCLKEGEPSSGYALTIDGKECPLSTEDFEKYWDYEHNSALPVRRAGLGVFVVGLGTGIAGIVLKVRRRKAARDAALPPAAGGAPLA